jgi:hypothetical protein
MPFLTGCLNYILRRGLWAFGAAITSILIGCVGVTPPSPSSQSFNNATQAENAKSGSTAWMIPQSNIALSHQIEGYASAGSVNRGGSIELFVNTTDAIYTIEVYRLGWYGGGGGRLVSSVKLQGIAQPACPTDPSTLLVSCAWQSPYVLQIPAPETDTSNNWTSGVYLAKLTGSASRKSSYISFVVRDDARKSQIRFQLSMNTWEAYEDWGGHSLYTAPRAFKVSFNRPFRRGAGTGNMIASGWDLSALRFLEREGYDVSYAADLDAHQSAAELLNHKILLFPSHHEYWSTAMRNNVQAAIDAGIHAVFLGSNNVYWQVRFENGADGSSNRIMVCYKAVIDPIATTDPSLTTVRFRDPPVNWPEEKMLGVMFNGAGIGVLADLVVGDSSHWIFEGTGVHSGDHVGPYLGREVDSQSGLEPANTTVLMDSPFTVPDGTFKSRMTIFQAKSGAYVFSAGTSNFSLGLDDFRSIAANYEPDASFPPDNATIQVMARNLFAHLGATK